MRRYLPVAATLMLVALMGGFAVLQKKGITQDTQAEAAVHGFLPRRSCGRLPAFLLRKKIPQPVMIDLSQKRFKGVALLYGKNFRQSLHPRQWEQYGHFSTYALDEQGNIYLVPTPFISIRPETFTLQKNIYKLDSRSGSVSIFMTLEDVMPSERNPYGVNAVAYDCEDHTLWVAAVDESTYQAEKGIVYHIDPRTKRVLQRIKGFDALTLKVVHTAQEKYLLAGSARDAGLYAFRVTPGGADNRPKKLFDLPDPNEHIRKIRVTKMDNIALETVPFSYSLIARSTKHDRTHFTATWASERGQWLVIKER